MIGLSLQLAGELRAAAIRARDGPISLYQQRDRVLTHLNQVLVNCFQFLVKVFSWHDVLKAPIRISQSRLSVCSQVRKIAIVFSANEFE